MAIRKPSAVLSGATSKDGAASGVRSQRLPAGAFARGRRPRDVIGRPAPKARARFSVLRDLPALLLYARPEKGSADTSDLLLPLYFVGGRGGTVRQPHTLRIAQLGFAVL